MDVLDEEQGEEGDHRVNPELVDERRQQIAHRLGVAGNRRDVFTERVVLGMND